MRRRFLLACGLVGWLGAGLGSSRAGAHPYHTSSAMADIRGQSLEVTLSVTPEDLQEALKRVSGKLPDIDRDPEVDALAKAYVASKFVVAAGKRELAMKWLGVEVEPDAARLFFEFTLPKKLDDVTVRNAVFFELAPAQINRVLVRRGNTKRTLRFRPNSPAKSLLRPRKSG